MKILIKMIVSIRVFKQNDTFVSFSIRHTKRNLHSALHCSAIMQSAVMLSVAVLSVVMLSIVVPSVVMLSVVVLRVRAPQNQL